MSNPQEIFGETLPAKLADNEKVANMDAVYQFNIKGDDGGSWVVDLGSDGEIVTEGEADGADCTIDMKSEDFMDMWSGKLPGAQAFMMGKIKIQGDMGLAMKLQNFIG